MVRHAARVLGLVLSGLILLLSLAGAFVFFRGEALFRSFISTESFRQLANQNLGKMIKTDAEFAPFRVEDGSWTLRTDWGRADGWPGEAIGLLEAKGAVIRVDPAAAWKEHVWRILGITFESGKFVLRMPNDALKRPVKKGLRPFYAAWLPQKLEMGDIVCDHADLELPFEGQTGRVRDTRVVAKLIGKDFNYHLNGGKVEFPLFPPSQVESMEVFVTREKVDIVGAKLRSPDPADAMRIELDGRVGMREDKGIQAKVKLVRVPFQQTLPPELRDVIQGRMSATLDYDRSPTGVAMKGEGRVDFQDLIIKNWPILDEFVRLHRLNDLSTLVFQEAGADLRIRGDEFLATNIALGLPGRFLLNGTASYNNRTHSAEVIADLSGMPLQTWLPRELASKVKADLKGNFWFVGEPRTLNQAQAGAWILMDGARLRVPAVLSRLEGKINLPKEVLLKRASLSARYMPEAFVLDYVELQTQRGVLLTGSGTLNREHDLELACVLSGLKLEALFQNKLRGNLEGESQLRANWKGRGFSFQTGEANGTIRVMGARLRATQLQRNLAKFLGNPALVDLQCEKAQTDWAWASDEMKLSKIDIFAPGQMGFTGEVHVSRQGDLKGLVWVGLRREDLRWLPRATTTVFAKQDRGLYWARVNLGGTVKKPEYDLVAQILQQVKKHPLSAIPILFRVLAMRWFA
jgi:hypothetical protein